MMKSNVLQLFFCIVASYFLIIMIPNFLKNCLPHHLLPCNIKYNEYFSILNIVTGGRERNRKKGGLKVRRKMTASEKLRADEKLDSFDSDNQYTEEDEGKF